MLAPLPVSVFSDPADVAKGAVEVGVISTMGVGVGVTDFPEGVAAVSPLSRIGATFSRFLRLEIVFVSKVGLMAVI